MSELLLGVDPSTNATGVTLLEVDGRPEAGDAVWSPGPGAVAVVRRLTIRPLDGYRELERKLSFLRSRLGDLADWPELVGPCRFVLENPTDYPYMGRRDRNAGGAAGKVGAAFGVAYVTLAEIAADHAGRGSTFDVVPSQRWLPRQPGRRGGSHPMRHEAAREWLRRRWPALASCTDDETFAAGVALFLLTRAPMMVGI